MTLIVAQRVGKAFYVVGDTILVDPSGQALRRPIEGVIKSAMLDHDACVSFAGDPEFADRALRAFAKLSFTGDVAFAMGEHFLRCHRMCKQATDFIIAVGEPHNLLLEVKDGRCRDVEVAWIGSSDGFERFQGYRIGALQDSDQPANTHEAAGERESDGEGNSPNFSMTFGIRLQPDGPDTDPALYNEMFDAMNSVIADETVPEVAGFVVPIANYSGRLRFMDYAGTVTGKMRFDQLGPSGTVPFGTAAEGGYSFCFGPSHEPNEKLVSIYFLQGRFGLIYEQRYEGFLFPNIIENVSAIEFEEAAEERFKTVFHTMLTNVGDICARARKRMKEGDLDGAMADAENAVARGPRHAVGYSCRAFVNSERHDEEAALDDLSKAIQLEPKNPRYWSNRAATLIRLNRLSEAVSDCTEAMKVSKDYLPAYQNRPVAYHRLGFPDLAERDAKCHEALRFR